MPKFLNSLRTYLFPPSSNIELRPERIRIAFSEQQASSERLVGWVQLFVVISFSLLYMTTPKTFSEEAEFAPVPWVLGAYFLFTLVHLRVSRKRLPSDSFTYLSICVDMSLIYLLIWSFHLQYMQPASFYLKAPTLLYVFIFIALRTLRFEVKFILFAGSMAILGWGVMILYVLLADPENTMITKDYVQYLTSNSMLLGAEFDKIITMLIVTLVLAAAMHRGKQLLLSSIIDNRKAEDLSHFVPDQVVADLNLSGEAPRAGQARCYQATVMFIDIANFTSISETLEADEVVANLNQYFTEVEQVLEQHGGIINQFQGDAILASFERPHEERNPAESAVQAAMDIQQRLDQLRFGVQKITFNSRIGINSGEVVGGMMGSAHRLIYTVHGDVVNIAARLEQLNKEFGSRILISGETRNACREGLFNFETRGETQVRGRNSMTQLYSLRE